MPVRTVLGMAAQASPAGAPPCALKHDMCRIEAGRMRLIKEIELEVFCDRNDWEYACCPPETHRST